MNRREVDQSRLSHLLVRPDWLARRTEAALDPGLPIIVLRAVLSSVLSSQTSAVTSAFRLN